MAKDKLTAYQKTMIEALASNQSTKTSHVFQSPRQIGKSTMEHWPYPYSKYTVNGFSTKIFDPIRGKTFTIGNDKPWSMYLTRIARSRKKKKVISRSALKKFHERLGMIILLQSEDVDMVHGKGHYNLEGYINIAKETFDRLDRYLQSTNTSRFELM